MMKMLLINLLYCLPWNDDEIINALELSADVLTITDSQNSHRNTASLVQDEDKHEGLMSID